MAKTKKAVKKAAPKKAAKKAAPKNSGITSGQVQKMIDDSIDLAVESIRGDIARISGDPSMVSNVIANAHASSIEKGGIRN